MVGYMGGNGTYPNYQNYTMANNYSETVRLVYDTTQTNFADLLAAYWAFVPPFSITQVRRGAVPVQPANLFFRTPHTHCTLYTHAHTLFPHHHLLESSLSE